MSAASTAAVRDGSAAPVFRPTVRPRVLDRIERAAAYPITLLVAPAGFGKSVALSQHLALGAGASSEPTVRFEAHAEHGGLLGFLRGLTEAATFIAPNARLTLAKAYELSEHAPNAAEALARWFAEHLDRFDGTIVVDEHHGTYEQSVAVLLTHLIDLTRRRLRWIIATRSAVDLPVAQWLAFDAMDLPIDESDLRLTLDEALEIARSAGAGGADPGDIEQLLALTDGLPAAFAIALRTSADPAALAHAGGTRESVYAYFAEQFYLGLDDDERAFLLETCVYPSVDAELLERAGRPGAATLMRSLRGRSACVSIESASVFRYHPPFRAFLEDELRKRGDEAFVRTARLAAERLERGGRPDDALAVQIRIANHPEIVRLLDAHGFAFLEQGRADVVQAALDVIPETLHEAHPNVLALDATFATRRGDHDRADLRFRAAIDRCADPIARAWLIHRFATDLLRRERRDACVALLEPLGDALGDAPVELAASVYATLATAQVHIPERSDDASRNADHALRLAAPVESRELRARVLHQGAYVAFFRNDVARSMELELNAVSIAQEAGLYDLCARAWSGIYSAAFHDDDRPKCLWAVKRLLECASKGGSPQLRLYGLLCLYDLEAERGDRDALAALDEQLESSGFVLPSWASSTLLPSRALKLAWSRAFARAHDLIAGTAEADPLADRQAERFAEIALYAAAAGRSDAARDALSGFDAALTRIRLEAEQDRSGIVVSWRAPRARAFAALAHLILGASDVAERLVAGDPEHEAGLSPRAHAMLAVTRAVVARCTTEPRNDRDLIEALNMLRAEHAEGIARLIEALPLGGTRRRAQAPSTPRGSM